MREFPRLRQRLSYLRNEIAVYEQLIFSGIPSSTEMEDSASRLRFEWLMAEAEEIEYLLRYAAYSWGWPALYRRGFGVFVVVVILLTVLAMWRVSLW